MGLTYCFLLRFYYHYFFSVIFQFQDHEFVPTIFKNRNEDSDGTSNTCAVHIPSEVVHKLFDIRQGGHFGIH